jgi:hypothetical protein
MGHRGARLLIVEVGERPRYPLPIAVALLIGGRLGLRAGQCVQDAQPRERQEIIEWVGQPPEEGEATRALIVK